MSLQEFMDYAGRLKRIKRAGWIIRGIPDPESVADHSYRAALLGLILARKEGLDGEKIVAMLLLHDLGEAIIGDIVPEGEEFIDKEKAEREAIRKILSTLGDIGEQLYSLWMEFHQGESEEAKLARIVDKAEMAYQAKEYREMGYNIDEDMLQHLPKFLK